MISTEIVSVFLINSYGKIYDIEIMTTMAIDLYKIEIMNAGKGVNFKQTKG